MIKNVFRKSLVIGIIVLFVGVSVVPSISRDIGELSSRSYKEDIGNIEPRQAFFYNPAEEERIKIPLKVNVLEGVDINASTIDQVVTDANEKLKKAGANVSFVFDKGKDINWNVSDTGNDDGKVSLDEMWNLNLGWWGLRHHFAIVSTADIQYLSCTGYKVWFTNEILNNPNIGGSSTTGEQEDDTIGLIMPQVPNAYLKKRDIITCAKGMGADLIHEFAHSMGVVNHSNYPSSVMYEVSSGRTGTSLSTDEINTILEGALQTGVAKKNGRIIRVNTKQTSWKDVTSDVSQNYIDLFIGSLFAEGPTADLEVAIGINGLHPNATNVKSRFQMGFDTDNNNSTGYYGSDKILRITLNGKYPFTSPNGSIIANLYDVASQTSVPLSPGGVVRMQQIVDVVEEPPIPEAFDYFDSIVQSFPLPLLGPLADTVPINLWATNLDTGEYDYTSFQFGFNLPPGATIEMEPLEALPGQKVNVNGTRFPVSTVTLLIDDTEILQTTPLDNGSFSVSFTVPNLASGWYFVTAMSDARGDQIINTTYFDFSILTVPSPPNKPTIDGPKKGKPGTSYDFIFNAVDPDNDNVKYLIDWGDGTTDTTDFNPSGTNVKVSHTWSSRRTYIIRANAEDVYGLIGPEATFTVTMPRNRAIDIPFLNYLQTHPNLFPILQKIIQR